MKKTAGLFLTLCFALLVLHSARGSCTRATRFAGMERDPGVKGATPAEDTSSVWERLGGIQWVFVQGGTSRMGSNDGRRNEKPVHRVTLGSFCMNATEVTFAQYDISCDSTEREKPPTPDGGGGGVP